MNRNFGLDILRILACFMVVGIHTTPVYIADGLGYNPTNLLMQALYRAGLPVFFILSGFFSLNKKWNIKSCIHSILKIAIPFILISLIHYTYLYGVSLEIFLDYIKTITTSITGVSVHFWFVYVILSLYASAPIITIILSRLNAKKSIITLIAILIVYAFLSNYTVLSFAFNTPELNFKPGPYVWVLYFIFGGLLARCSWMINRYIPFALVFFGLIATYKLSAISFIDFRPYDINATMLIYSSALLVIFVNLDSKVKKMSDNTKKTIKSLSDKTYIVYLTHIMVLDVITSKLPEFSNEISKTNCYILLTLTCFIFSFFVSFIITPFTNCAIWLASFLVNVLPKSKINSQLPSNTQ